MSATAVRSLFQAFAEPGSGSCLPRDDGLTLEQQISSVWEGLRAAGTAYCPVCRGAMERVGDHAQCTRCGSVLS